MSRKINLLILSSVVGFLAFSAIQTYLINNTYKLKKDVFLNDTRRSISRLDDFSPLLDSINEAWQTHFLDEVADYQEGKLPKNEVIESLQLFTGDLNKSYKSSYKEELDKSSVSYDLKFQKRVKTIFILDSLQNDTLFHSGANSGFHLIGDSFEREDGHRISNSLWLTDHTYQVPQGDSTVTRGYDLQFETEDVMNIDGWERIVLNQMKWLLIMSISIFLFVFGLLYYSIKNLITQKKIADIKTDFVNNITHELKTPLATLSLATKMIKKEAVIHQPELLKETIQTVDRQNIRLQKLIDQVLHNSLGYREIKLRKEKVESGPYVSHIVSDFILSQNDKTVKPSMNLMPQSPSITIDKFFITTALLNVLENAIKYGGDQIEVTTQEVENDFVISIQDNGMGISSKDKKSIFEKFYRVGNKEIHNVKGLGLGLYYTHQIIQAHGGVIQVESVLNEGSTFHIKIPLN